MQPIKLHTFHGGIHPSENKTQSSQTPIQALSLPPVLVLPLRQHSGSPARPCVAVGELVLKGQVIARAQGARSLNVHAPTSGRISQIAPRPIAHSSGLSELCIELIPDGQEQWLEHSSLFTKLGITELEKLPAAALVEAIAEAGIAGLGGAGFPTHLKLQPAQAPKLLIINAAECEPYISADDRLMRERALEVILGTALLLQACGAPQCLIGIEDNKSEAISALQAQIQAQGLGTRIQLVVIPTLYPSGGEKQLIKILTGQEVPSGGIPAQLGILCQNAGTAAAVYRAIYLGEPLISRISTVTGAAIAKPGNYEVLIGTLVPFVLEQTGYRAQQPERVISGGPLMGFTLPNLNVTMTKTSNCLLAPSAQELPLPELAMACIRCGQCVEACPQELLPQQLYWFAKGEEYAKAEQHNLLDCIECGACSYVCPSQIPLVQYYRHSKGEILAERAATQKSEQARLRFENRNARHERLEAEKEAQRKARAEAAALAKAEREACEAQAQASASEVAAAAQAEALEPNANPSAELERKILAQTDRVQKMQERIDLARQEQLDTVATLEQALQKQQEKLAQLNAELAALQAGA
jgi:electron transport complex protein RnfC